MGISKRKETLFRIAKNVAALSNFKYRLGAVLYKQHKIVSSGCNSDTDTDPVQSKLDFERHGCICPGKLHAETSALLPFIKRTRMNQFQENKLTKFLIIDTIISISN